MAAEGKPSKRRASDRKQAEIVKAAVPASPEAANGRGASRHNGEAAPDDGPVTHVNDGGTPAAAASRPSAPPSRRLQKTKSRQQSQRRSWRAVPTWLWQAAAMVGIAIAITVMTGVQLHATAGDVTLAFG